MLPVTIDKCGDGPSAEIIKSSTDKQKAFASKVFDRRCKIESRGKPGFDGVSLVRSEIRQVIGHQRTHVSSQYFLARARVGATAVQCRNDTPEQKRYSGHGRANRQWPPPTRNGFRSFDRLRLRESRKDTTSQVGRGLESATATLHQGL